MPDAERARLMRRLGELLTRDAVALVQIESWDNGKIIRETTAKARSLQGYLDHFAGAADKLLVQQPPGTVWVNSYRNVSYIAPFGGFKQSGYGRDNGLAAIDGNLHARTVLIELTGATRDPFVVG